MAKFGKALILLFAALVVVVVVAAASILLFFDPNDFRDEISAAVKEETGRDLTIDEISFSVFPWLAVGLGETTLGNADGFGDEPFVRFESANLSVRLMPLLFERRIAVGTASLDGFVANLAVAPSGVTNWDDLSQQADGPVQLDETPEESEAFMLDIANISLNDAQLSYVDAQAGTAYAITDLSVASGRIALDEPFDIEAGFAFKADPDDLGGNVQISANITLGEESVAVDGFNIEGTVDGIVSEPMDFFLASRAMSVDAAAERLSLGEIDLGLLGLNMSATVEPFVYSGPTNIRSTLRVNDFSLKELLARLDIEAPETADANALSRLSFEATADLSDDALALSSMSLVMDDTTMQGDLSVPLTADGALAFDLQADSITLDNYLAPPAEAEVADTEEAVDVVIPADLVRTLNANGSVRMQQAFLGPIEFTNLELGVDSGNGRLRLNPITATFFEGAYNGDVRIDATGNIPSLSVDERIEGVDLSAMARSLYEVDSLTGTIEGRFQLAGAGNTLSEVTADLDGEMRFLLADGEWQGTDVWHQLRSARALFKREPAPEPRLPARTEFTAVSLSGTVTDGIFNSDDLNVQMPFLQITGGGAVNLIESTIDYSVQARVLERPEFVSGASDEELLDFTEALIPIRVTGALTEPSFRPDIEAMFRAEVENAIEEKTEELKRDLLDSLLGTDDERAGEGADAEEEQQEPEDVLEDALRDLFPR